MNRTISRLIALAVILLLNFQVGWAQAMIEEPADPGTEFSAEIVPADETPHVNGTYTYSLYANRGYSEVIWTVTGGVKVSETLLSVTVKWSGSNGNITARMNGRDEWMNSYYLGSASYMTGIAPDPLQSINVPSSVICEGKSISLSHANELYFAHSAEGIIARGTDITIIPYSANSSLYRITGWIGDYAEQKTIQVQVSHRPTLPALQDVTIIGAGNVTLTVQNPQVGHEYLWYRDAVGGASFTVGTSYGFYASQTTTFYVSSRLQGACESNSRVPVKVTVDYGANVQQMNFIVTTSVREKGITDKGKLDELALDKKATVYSYFDEFGKPVQTVLKQASPGQTDIVQPVYYDAFGLETKSYLPYAGGADGKYKADAIKAQAAFYSVSGPADIADDAKPYAEVILDSSPLFMATTRKGVGAAWGSNSSHLKVRANTSTDAVRRWNADGTANGTYPEANLTVSEVVNEQGNKSLVFVNGLGQKVLERRQLDETIDGQSVPFADTYYLYDDLGRLTTTIAPQALVEMQKAGNYALTTELKKAWAYSYVYDSRGRLIEKKVPGAETVYMAYDKLDRLVLVQDGNQRKGSNWYFTKYDRWSRPVVEGTYANTVQTTRGDMQNLIDTGNELLYENRAAGTEHGYTTSRTFPTAVTAAGVLSVSYYDDYDFDNNGVRDAHGNYLKQNLTKEPEPHTTAKGTVTATKKRVLGTNNWLWNVLLYDERRQVVQIRSNNHKNLNVEDAVTTVYAFSGDVEKTVKTHKISDSGSAIVVENIFTHDHMGRLREVKQINKIGNSANERVVAQYTYNALGQLVDKELHKDGATGKFLQSVDYRYNIRGQLININSSNLSGAISGANDSEADVFGMELLYENTQAFDGGVSNTARYDGLVSAVKWQVRKTGAASNTAKQMERAYRVSYDKLGRMTEALFAGNETGSWSSDVGYFNESLTYDANGNIRTLRRKGLNSNGAAVDLDIMTYNYILNGVNQGNALVGVTDLGDKTNGFLDKADLAKEYEYDPNGNVEADHNKGVTVTYNVLNKVQQVTHTDGRYLKYSYSAAGAVLTKEERDIGGQVVLTDYASGFVYTDGRLDYFGMAEGRVVNTGSAAYTVTDLKYEYFISDHLGNVRVAFREESGKAMVWQENHYYPFGLRITGMDTNADVSHNKQRFNASSEWQAIFGTYSTFYRHYDPALGRMLAVDPLADYFASWTPYQYGFNSPFSFNDPTGAISNPGFSADVWSVIENAWNSTERGKNTHWEKNSDGSWTSQYFTIEQDGGGNWGFWYYPGSTGSVGSDGTVTVTAERARWVELTKSESVNLQNTWSSIEQNLARLKTAGDFLGITGSINSIFSEAGKIALKEVKPAHFFKEGALASYSKAANQVKLINRAGVVGNLLSVGVSAVQMHQRGYSTASVVDFGFDLAIGAVSFIPYVGVPASIIIGSINQSGGLDDVKQGVVDFLK